MASYAIDNTQSIPNGSPLGLVLDNLAALNNGGGTALPGTTGTVVATMDGSIKTSTPTGAITFNATGTFGAGVVGLVGQICTWVITTSGVSSFTLTFGTNFKVTGTLATGTVSGKVFVIQFVYDGVNWNEVARTTAM